MSIKITIPNSSSDVLTFGSGNTPTAAQIAGIDSGSSNGQLALYTTASGTSTERVRVNASGNVGVGTSSPAATQSGLDISSGGLSLIVGADSGGSTRTNTTTKIGRISSYHYTNAEEPVAIVVTSIESGANTIQFGGGSGLLNAATDLRFLTAATTTTTTGTERMRIDSSGNLLVGTTSSYGGASRVCVTGPATANQQQISCHNPSTSGTRLFVAFGTEATYTERGWIQWNGSTMALTNASDSRLKENIVNAPSALTKIAAMQIRSFDFKEDGRHVDYGVVAQELNEVLPSAVFEGSDNEDGSINKPWSVGLEPIIPILVKAIQEQQAIITSLTDRITALENK